MAVGARCAFAARGGSAGIDGISYLDVAHADLRHDWSSAINSYWGPLYSWLLALAMWVTRASEAKELALARLVDLVTHSESAFLLALFILAMFSPLNFLRGLGRSWFYFLPTLASVVMYVLVFMTWRYMLAFSRLLWGVAPSAVAVPVQLRSAVRPVLQAAILVFALRLVHFLVGQNHEAGREMAIASSLTSAGIERGDLVASIGQGQDATWAHMAGVSIAAEVWTIDGTGFWNSSVSEQDGIVEQILQTGAKAIVWRRDSPQLCPSPWREIPNFAGCLRTP